MDSSGIPQNIDDAKMQYPHLTQEMVASFLEAEATPAQWKAADMKAKTNIDMQLENYKYFHKPDIMEGIKVMVIGATGSGKSATSNTLIGYQWFGEAYSADSETSVTSVPSEPCAKVFPIDNTILKANLVVCDTPRSWQSQTRSHGLDEVDCYIVVINLATPRFNQETLTKIKSLKGIDGALIVESGRFVVVLSHADRALQGISLNQYLDEIHGDPLHTFLIQVAEGRVVAINNAAETEYQQERQQMMLFGLLAQVYNQIPVQPRKERTSSFKEGLTNVMSSAKRIGSLAVGEVFVKARARLASTSESSGETVHPPAQERGRGENYARSWSMPDPSVKTSQPLAQDVEIKGRDEPSAPLPQEQQQPQQQQQQQQQQQHPQGEQVKEESAGDQQLPTGSLAMGSGDNQEPMVKENGISDKTEEHERGI